MAEKEIPELDPNRVKGAPRLRHPKQCHLRSGQDFSRVYREGVRVRGSLILLVAAPSLNPLAPRLGLSVGKKFAKSAVARNRVRRIFRESFRLARPDLPVLDIIMIPMGKGEAYTVQKCKPELLRLSKKAMQKWHKRQESG
jgi:ribonuclease P protein component